jgi:hypothetical protein
VDAAEPPKLIENGESDLVELKQSMSDGDKIRESICVDHVFASSPIGATVRRLARRSLYVSR